MNDWQIGMQLMARAPAPTPVIDGGDAPTVYIRPETQKRAANRTQSVIDMLKRGKYTAIQVAAAESISLDYVREVIQRINGVQRRRVGTTYQYWIEP